MSENRDGENRAIGNGDGESRTIGNRDGGFRASENREGETGTIEWRDDESRYIGNREGEREPPGVTYPIRFTGSGGAYFRIWIVNVLLSIVTLYVYSAWAKVRTKRYFHGNTVLDGSSFEYHARPLQILAGRVIAVALLLLVTVAGVIHPALSGLSTLALFVVLPWAVWRSTKFNARMTSYRNVRFGFDGSLGGMYLYTQILPLLAPLLAGAAAVLAAGVIGAGNAVVAGMVLAGVLGFYALAPWVHRKLSGYLANHYRYGRAPFAATLSSRRFYAIYLLSALLGLALLTLAAASVAALGWATGALSPERLEALLGSDRAEPPDAMLGAVPFAAIVGLYVAFLLAGYLVSAFFRARVRNYLYAATVVDGRVRLESNVRVWPLWRLMVGNLALLILTLGLAWPWIKVRVARFFAENTRVHAAGGLHAVVDDELAHRSALGEEIGDAFDVDVDVGF